MVEGFNSGRGQWIGRSAQNKAVNFVIEAEVPVVGGYYDVRITATFPNSLGGVLVSTEWVPAQKPWSALPVLQ